MSKPLLRTLKLVKNYIDGSRTLEVLRGIDFSLQPGEVVAITGKSGSGKSTLLNLLCMLDRPTNGTIFYNTSSSGDREYSLADMSNSDLNRLRCHSIGLVFQFHHLLQEFRAWENVAMPAFIAGMDRKAAHERALELLDQVELRDRAEHLPTKLSGGEQQRVALARALMNDPKIILADEPTGNLDVKTADAMASLLWKTTRDRGRSLIIVTHEPSIAANADRVMELRDGLLHRV
ncbi:MAG TPA: ABC transporter ATP-binding protein [Candidatus Sumerlaeota bacterium]|nr:ABC transporter ATP-binding protein [Candidatus Sumerlaeota bacterium]HPS00016.1 ABC transporter ATP-binding protein [Candidatus Sumerlaeota bacterium]